MSRFAVFNFILCFKFITSLRFVKYIRFKQKVEYFIIFCFILVIFYYFFYCCNCSRIYHLNPNLRLVASDYWSRLPEIIR